MNAILRILAISPVALLLSAVMASAQYGTFITQSAGPYWRVDVGSGVPGHNELTEFGGLTSGNTIEYDPGFALNTAIGYAFNEWVATELEFGWTWNEIDSIQGLQLLDTTFSTAPVLVNAVLQYPIPGTYIVPYLGGGVGGAFTVFDTDGARYQGGGGSLTVFGTDSDFVFAYQGFAGVRFELGERAQLGLGYKYVRVHESTFGGDYDFYFNELPRLGVSSLGIHVATLTFTFKF